MARERVVYYSSIDFLYGWKLEKIETMPVPDFQTIGINDAIEFYQIHRYFEEGARAKHWTDEQFGLYTAKSRELFALTGRFFNVLSDATIEDEYDKVDNLYKTAFWELFERFKLYRKITAEVFKVLFYNEHVPIYDVFKRENTVKEYGAILRRYILDNLWCAALLLHYAEQEKNDDDRLYLPVELTGQDIVEYFGKYIETESANPNYLRDIIYLPKSDRFPISDELRLMAKRRYADEMEKFKEKGTRLLNTIKISIVNNQQEELLNRSQGSNVDVAYSREWLLDTLDYPSILNNFIYLFEYVDYLEMRSLHISVDAIAGTLEKTFFFPSRRWQYPTYCAFNHVNGLAMLQLQTYYQFLLSQGIYFEDVLQWVFTNYLQEEFNCPEIRVSLPSKQSTICEKCEQICSAMEIVVKQFTQYAEKKTIDFELLAISSGSPTYSQIPSLVQGKYIYGAGKDFNKIRYLLFSDQCLLSYVERISKEKKHYHYFYDLLLNEQVKKQDYHEQYYADLGFLSAHGLITIAEDGTIHLGDQSKLVLLYDLYRHDVVSRWHYPTYIQPIIQQWIDQGLLREGSTLLTEPEARYFNYLLNHADYCNGPDLRNTYAHGNGHIISDEDEHRENYNTLLRLMTILAIKINDDFCLFEQMKEE